MKKLLALIFIAVSLLSVPNVVHAINITVPQATGFGSILRGNANGSYTPVATSSLGLPTFAWPFDVSSNYVSTSSKPVGFLNGIFSTASSTFSGNNFFSALSQGFAYLGTGGKLNTIASSSIALSWFNNDAGFLTGNQTITLSGDVSGSGSTAITATVANDSHDHTSATISGIDISADTNLTAGDALTLTDDDIDFDGGASPAGDLGGTWANPSVDDDSHAHTGTTLSGIDISDDTNLTAGDHITLTGDDLDIDDDFLLNTSDTFSGLLSGPYSSSTIYSSFITASTTNLNIGGQSFIGLLGNGLDNTNGILTANCVEITGSADLCDGSDASGVGGSSAFEIATTSDIALSQLAYIAKTGGRTTLASVATGTISVPTGLTITANRYAVGGSATIGLDTGYVIPLQATLDAKALAATTITVNGTANQITSSAGAQDLSANRTWTLSFPNQVIFPQYASSTLGFSTPYASSTDLRAGTFTIGGDSLTELVGDGFENSAGTLIFDCSDVASTGITCSGEDITASLGTSIDLASAEVTGILSIANGGTNATTYANNTLIFFDGTRFVSTSTHPLYVGAVVATSTTIDSSFSAGFSVGSRLSVSNTGFGTTTLSGLNISGQATSTSNVGFNITNGCYAINGTCVGGGGVVEGSTIAIKFSTTTGSYLSHSYSMEAGDTVMWWGSCGRATTNERITLRRRTANEAASTTEYQTSNNNSQVTAFAAFTATTTYVVSIDVVQEQGCDEGGAELMSQLIPSAIASGGGSGDITSVGDVTDGAAFDGTQGTTLTFNNAGGDATLDYDGTDLQFSKLINFPYSSSTIYSSFITASSTNYLGAGLQTCDPTTGKLTWSGGQFSCGTDTSGSGSSKWATSTVTDAIYNATGNGGGYVGIGTTTPMWSLQVSSSTAPQLALGDGTNPQWTFRNAGGNLYFATSSPDTFATSTQFLSLKNSGQLSFGYRGNATVPSIASDENSTTGIYFPSATSIGFATNGTERMTLSASGVIATNLNSTGYIRVGDGNHQTAPSYSFTSSQDTGFSNNFGGIRVTSNGTFVAYFDDLKTSIRNEFWVFNEYDGENPFVVANYPSTSTPMFSIKTTGGVLQATDDPNTFVGKIGIASSTPTAARLVVDSEAGDLFSLWVGSTTAPWLRVSNSGFGTTTLSGLNIAGSATSTSNVGFNITNGCYAISGTCIGGGGGSGTVTSVGLATPNSTLSLGGTNPVTTTGTINVDLNLGNANTWTVNQTFNYSSSTIYSSFLVASSSKYISGAGSASTPSFTFTNDENTGIYRSAADVLALTAGGIQQVGISSNLLQISQTTGAIETGTGSANSPSYRFNTDTNTGLFGDTSDLLGFATAGTERMRIGATGQVGIATTTSWLNSILTTVGTTTIKGQLTSLRSSTTAATTQNIDWSTGNFQDIMLTGNTNIVVNATSSNPLDGAKYTLRICQDGTGSHTVTWANPIHLRWWNATTTITSTANKCTMIGMIYSQTNGNRIYSVVASSTNIDIR